MKMMRKKNKQPKRGTEEYKLLMAQSRLSAHTADNTNISAANTDNRKRMKKVIEGVLIGLKIGRSVVKEILNEVIATLLLHIGSGGVYPMTVGILCSIVLSIVIDRLETIKDSMPETKTVDAEPKSYDSSKEYRSCHTDEVDID